MSLVIQFTPDLFSSIDVRWQYSFCTHIVGLGDAEASENICENLKAFQLGHVLCQVEGGITKPFRRSQYASDCPTPCSIPAPALDDLQAAGSRLRQVGALAEIGRTSPIPSWSELGFVDSPLWNIATLPSALFPFREMGGILLGDLHRSHSAGRITQITLSAILH